MYKEFSKYRLAYRHFDSFQNETALVMLHEGLGSIAQWKNLPQKLHQLIKLPLIIYERPGYGNSYPKKMNYSRHYLEEEAWQILPQFLAQFSYKNYIFYGHSDGATITLLFAAKFPEQTKAVIAESPHVIVENRTIKGIKEVITIKDKIIRALNKYHSDNTTEVFNRWSGVWLSPDFTNWDARPMLKNLTSPTLLIQTQDDQYASMRQLDEIHSLSKTTCHELRLSHGGHAPHINLETLICQYILEFVESLN